VTQTRIVEVRAGILKKNDELARALRSRFEDAGVYVVNLVSSPGTGKTQLLERTLSELAAVGVRTAALVGDLATDNDARRLARSGVPVKQINTHGRCHLEAEMIGDYLADWDLATLDFLFIENVGNLVCPASYDLGESLRVALLSVTEGEDKPLKYPTMFNSADVALITKIDLADACEFDHAAARAALHDVRPGLETLELSSKRGTGFAAWMALLHDRRAAWTRRAPFPAPGGP
jgi:hydrogenase nickel incorporation protein HypB